MGRTFNFVADSMNGREKNLPPSGTEFGLYMMAARASCGTISFNISRYFPATLACRTVKPVMLPPRSRQARDKPATNRIGHSDEHDRNGPCGLHQRGGDRGALAENAVGLELDQLFRERLHARGVAAFG